MRTVLLCLLDGSHAINRTLRISLSGLSEGLAPSLSAIGLPDEVDKATYGLAMGKPLRPPEKCNVERAPNCAGMPI